MNEVKYTSSEIKQALENIGPTITTRAYHHFRIQRLREISCQRHPKEEHIIIDSPFGQIVYEELIVELDRLKE